MSRTTATPRGKAMRSFYAETRLHGSLVRVYAPFTPGNRLHRGQLNLKSYNPVLSIIDHHDKFIIISRQNKHQNPPTLLNDQSYIRIPRCNRAICTFLFFNANRKGVFPIPSTRRSNLSKSVHSILPRAMQRIILGVNVDKAVWQAQYNLQISFTRHNVQQGPP